MNTVTIREHRELDDKDIFVKLVALLWYCRGKDMIGFSIDGTNYDIELYDTRRKTYTSVRFRDALTGDDVAVAFSDRNDGRIIWVSSNAPAGLLQRLNRKRLNLRLTYEKRANGMYFTDPTSKPKWPLMDTETGNYSSDNPIHAVNGVDLRVSSIGNE